MTSERQWPTYMLTTAALHLTHHFISSSSIKPSSSSSTYLYFHCKTKAAPSDLQLPLSCASWLQLRPVDYQSTQFSALLSCAAPIIWKRKTWLVHSSKSAICKTIHLEQDLRTMVSNIATKKGHRSAVAIFENYPIEWPSVVRIEWPSVIEQKTITTSAMSTVDFIL